MTRYPMFVALVSAMILVVSAEKLSCAKEEQGARSLKLSLKGKRNHTGDWTADLRVRSEMSNTTGDLDVEVEHRIFECDGRAVVEIQGSSRGPTSDKGHLNAEDKILFDVKCAKNAVVINAGRSAFRMNAETESEYGTLLSSKALHDDEIFEVRLEKRLTKWGPHSIGIGVTSIPISSFTFGAWANTIKSGTWMMYDADFYIDSKMKKEGYGKNLGSLQAGDKMGVMRTSNGDLHIYINGIDQGVAATGVPANIYGVVDLIRNFVSVSIV